MLYGAIYDDRPSNAAPGCVWTKQIESPLRWLEAFLAGHAGDIVRTMTTDAHYRRGCRVEITTDASPWGIGGFICIDGVPEEWFAMAVSPSDAKHLGICFAEDSTGQQAYEALALLVALRVWRSKWNTRRCCIQVATDNVSALAMVCRMQPHSKSLGAVAREIALDIADAIYEPQLVEHVPGVANVIADALSRRFDPNAAPFVLPAPLLHAEEVHPPERVETWWRARKCPDFVMKEDKGHTR